MNKHKCFTIDLPEKDGGVLKEIHVVFNKNNKRLYLVCPDKKLCQIILVAHQCTFNDRALDYDKVTEIGALLSETECGSLLFKTPIRYKADPEAELFYEEIPA